MVLDPLHLPCTGVVSPTRELPFLFLRLLLLSLLSFPYFDIFAYVGISFNWTPIIDIRSQYIIQIKLEKIRFTPGLYGSHIFFIICRKYTEKKGLWKGIKEDRLWICPL